MGANGHVTVEFSTSPEFKQELEDAAAKLNLSLGAYVQYLMTRQTVSVGPKRFDRMVREVFGRYGSAMRNLAK